MNSNCIVTQVHIPDFDVQGHLTKDEKLNLVEFGIEHLRKFNQNSYIILTGHGYRPNNTHLCDYVYWEDTCRDLNQHGYVTGMPAQFYFVSIGIEHAIHKGFTRLLKTRGDCVIGIPNITNFCEDILQQENKKLLITQQTGMDRMGDCFMYGNSDLLHRIWHKDNLVYHSDGLQNTAYHFRNVIGLHHLSWVDIVKLICAFRDVDKLKFMCLRWNYHNLEKLNDKIKELLLDPNFTFELYHWGKVNGWHLFNNDRDMSGSADWLWSQKQFYNI